MKQINITVNGQDYKVEENITILEAVTSLKIAEIPTLCYEKRLGHINSCYLCVVEVKGARTLLPSCSTKVAEGMVIETDSENVAAARKECLTLLMSDHCADCYSPCRLECPAEIDIQGYLKLTEQSLFKEAVELIKQTNPLPIVCGRVCVRPCELKCRRELVDQSIAIDSVKRTISESEDGLKSETLQNKGNGKKIAVIGAGPAGLSFSYYAAQAGYNVTVFEAMPQAGGMLRYGIPSYRLPKELLDLEIKAIEDMGVSFKYNTALGTNLQFEEIKKSFDYFFVACGAWKASDAGIENGASVTSGLDFLRKAYTDENNDLTGLKVAVIGGGNTAIDASRTAIRLKASEVTIIYRRTEDEMPAHHEEIDAAKKEGVKLLLLTAPKKVLNENSKITGLECIKMQLGEADESGRRRPVEIAGSEFIKKFDLVITATGQSSNFDFLPENVVASRGRIQAAKNQQTSSVNIFAGGDAVTGPSTVIEAIASGKKALTAIIAVENDKGFYVSKDFFGPLTEKSVPEVPKAKRAEMEQRPARIRATDFMETETSLSPAKAAAESKRCLECGCSATLYCLLKKYASQYSVSSAYTSGNRENNPADRSHPNIILDNSKCIKCQRCIKTCENILGYSVLGLRNRGFVSAIIPEMDKKLAESTCISCGNCLDSCPTGAISDKEGYFPFESDREKSNCMFCNALCEISLSSYGRFVRVSPARDKVNGDGDYLCKYGRFAMNRFFDTDRITGAGIKNKDGMLAKASVGDACKNVSEKLKEIAKKYTPDSIAVFISPTMPSAAVYAAVKLAKGIIGTDNVFSFRHKYDKYHQDFTVKNSPVISTASLDRLEQSDIIILTGASAGKTVPAVNWKIRSAVKNGAKLIIVGDTDTKLKNIAYDIIEPENGTLGKFFLVISKFITASGDAAVNKRMAEIKNSDGFVKHLNSIKDIAFLGIDEQSLRTTANTLIENSPKITFIYDTNTKDGCIMEILNLMLLTNSVSGNGKGLILLEDGANNDGLKKWGAWPGMLPGFRSLEEPQDREIFEKLWQSKLPAAKSKMNLAEFKGALFIGEDLPAAQIKSSLSGLEFLAVCSLYHSEFTQKADVILPLTTTAETGGTVTAFNYTEKNISQSVKPLADEPITEILNKIAGGDGKNLIPAGEMEKIESKINNPAYLTGFITETMPKASRKATGNKLEVPFRRYNKINMER